MLLSVKDETSDVININDSKWNDLFNLYSDKIDNIYFIGYKLFIRNSNHIELIEDMCETLIFNEGFYKVCFKVKHAFLSINRMQISKLWDYYEYPALIFINDKINVNKFIQIVKGDFYYNNVVSSLSNSVIFYKSFEENVLWIAKSNDVDFKY